MFSTIGSVQIAFTLPEHRLSIPMTRRSDRTILMDADSGRSALVNVTLSTIALIG